MSEAHENIVFAKVDIDDEELHDLVAEAQVSAVPTYTFSVSGETVAPPIQGANMRAIQQILDGVTE